MSFRLPTFNLPCSIWRHNRDWRTLPPDVETFCNLTPGKRVTIPVAFTTVTALGSVYMMVLLPKGTDIRSNEDSPVQGDLIMVPTGTTRLYRVHFVDDIGKGFDNEHRFAALEHYNSAGTWTFPMQ